jgi:hypothetical protein
LASGISAFSITSLPSVLLNQVPVIDMLKDDKDMEEMFKAPTTTLN